MRELSMEGGRRMHHQERTIRSGSPPKNQKSVASALATSG
jgi:hypothetical protein